jgi:hypothetical protein
MVAYAAAVLAAPWADIVDDALLVRLQAGEQAGLSHGVVEAL